MYYTGLYALYGYTFYILGFLPKKNSQVDFMTRILTSDVRNSDVTLSFFSYYNVRKNVCDVRVPKDDINVHGS